MGLGATAYVAIGLEISLEIILVVLALGSRQNAVYQISNDI
jgi:hypothetical protein